ncbi:hypothetical protein BN2497_6819 [Janthinobacterium sp. CG23_2]|nr:hypothetical protein BN2497_6819 [Janthinobacterium sp. CG23_2]CUU29807.1 hypothetical protein BN3177_6819 [Janthinobacterium sp. CG23_2]
MPIPHAEDHRTHQERRVNLSPAIPILRIFSEQKVTEFYLNFLGFA